MDKVNYFDYASSTPIDPFVAEKMFSCMTEKGYFANPASNTHRLGWEAAEQVEWARELVANCIGSNPMEIVWTSGATESDNLALKGVVESLYPQAGRNKIVTLASEHKAVLDPLYALKRIGIEPIVLRPQKDGLIDLDQLAMVLDEKVLLVSIMAVNNETGVIQPLRQICNLARGVGALVHSDFAQAMGKLDFSVSSLGVDLASFSAHKAIGPKGIGVLYVRRSPELKLSQQQHGGGHERGMRSGTLPTHQIVGMAEAFKLVDASFEEDLARVKTFRNKVLDLFETVGGVSINGKQTVPHIINCTVEGIYAETLIAATPEIAISSGSACNSATVEPSHVLKAMGLSREEGLSSIRISFGKSTNDTEVEILLSTLKRAIIGLREGLV